MNRTTKTTLFHCFFLLSTLWVCCPTQVNAQQGPVKGFMCYGKLAQGVANANKLGWRVGIQTYSFNKFTFFEAIDMTSALGLNYIEGVAGMRLSPESDVKFGHGLSAEWREKLKKKLDESGIEHVSYYQWMNGTGEGFEDIVKFAKELNLTIVTDPKRAPEGKPVDYYESILDKYGVTMVFTNHPRPIAYWNPEYALEDTKNRSKNLGASVDIGHYMRAGFEPLPIVKDFINAGRMYHFHFRDVSQVGPTGVDVPLGKGKAQIKEILTALKDNDVKPIIMLEYEADFYNQMLYLIPSVNYLDQVAGELLKDDKKNQP